mgnify:CR=1 FL=1
MSTSDETTHKGSCVCGAVEVTATGAPFAMGYCHCKDCRAWSAGPVNAFTLWKRHAVEITQGAEHITTHKKTEASHRQSCSKCGGHVMTDHPGGDFTDVYAAILPSPAFEPGLHVHSESTVLPTKDGLPKTKALPGDMGGPGGAARGGPGAQARLSQGAHAGQQGGHAAGFRIRTQQPHQGGDARAGVGGQAGRGYAGGGSRFPAAAGRVGVQVHETRENPRPIQVELLLHQLSGHLGQALADPEHPTAAQDQGPATQAAGRVQIGVVQDGEHGGSKGRGGLGPHHPSKLARDFT